MEVYVIKNPTALAVGVSEALKAYDDFPNSIPCMNAKGETVPDLMVGDWNDEKCLIKKLRNLR